jgi:hypothetical protein
MSSQSEILDETVSIPDVLSCLLVHDAETKRWNGHCLDFDIVTSGLNADAAWANLKEVVKLHIEQCFTNWQEGLKRRARQECWDLFERLERSEKLFRQDRIELDLVAPKHDEFEFWMKALVPLEVCGNGKVKAAPLQ